MAGVFGVPKVAGLGTLAHRGTSVRYESDTRTLTAGAARFYIFRMVLLKASSLDLAPRKPSLSWQQIVVQR